MAKDQRLLEIRICPECELAAHRVPESDVGKQLAFQCDNGHKIFLVTTPAALKAVAVKGHVVEAVVVLAKPAPAKPKAAPKKPLSKDTKSAAKPKAKAKPKPKPTRPMRILG